MHVHNQNQGNHDDAVDREDGGGGQLTCRRITCCGIWCRVDADRCPLISPGRRRNSPEEEEEKKEEKKEEEKEEEKRGVEEEPMGLV